jgi:tetratricopeptide (TPR) repeat protein
LATEEKNKAEAATTRATDALDKVKRANTAAKSSAHEATSARNEAQNVMEFMLFDLPKKLDPIGRLDLLDDVNRRTLDYYKSHSNDKDAQRGYSAALRNKGNILYGRGELPGALDTYEKAFKIIKNVANQDPANVKVQHDLWESGQKMADVLLDQSKFEDAKKSYDDGLLILEDLTKKAPANLEWQLDLSESYDSVGNTLCENAEHLLASAERYDSRGYAILSPDEEEEFREKLKKAGELFENSRDVAQRVADSEPHNSRHYSRARFLMALAFARHADVLWNQGDAAGSLEADKQDLSIMEKLAENEPPNAGWQRELSMLYGRLADKLAIKGKKGNYPEVVERYRNALKGFGKLAAQDPTNVDWQYNLILYYYRAAVVMNKMGPKSKTEAREFIEKGKEIKRKLEKVDMTPRQTNDLKALEKQLP